MHGFVTMALGQDYPLCDHGPRGNGLFGGTLGAVAVEAASSSSGLAAYSSRLSRFSDEYEFFDALNLMGMFVTSLGVCTARIWARMLDRVVWKPLRQHRRSWQFVSELFNIILDRLTDSSGDGVTLDNVYDKSYMNSFFEAAETATRRYYQGCT